MTGASARLRRLEGLRGSYGDGAADTKLSLLQRLRRSRLRTAGEVLRLHEALLWMRAYPDDTRVLEAVERFLAGFEHRPDLRGLRPSLADSGIAGTPIHYRFYWPTAAWLVDRWPERLSIDWERIEDTSRLEEALPLLVGPMLRRGLASVGLDPRRALERVRPSGVTDAAFLVRRVGSVIGDSFTREALHDGIDLPYRLGPGPGGPSRTHGRDARAPVVFREAALPRIRPDLLVEIRRPPRAIRLLPPADGRRLIDLAREAMVTRSRDLDCFAWGDPRDVRVVDDGDGLRFAWIGTVPERRLALQAAYGALTLRNGVPTGYVQADALLGSVEISYNTFATFRGGEAAWVFARVLAACRVLFGARSFSVEPYQLGRGNAEGIASGAWWFYYKLGFRPRDRDVRRIARRERDLMRRRPGHRSSTATLESLARAHVFWEPEGERAPVLSELQAAALFARQDGAAEAARLLGVSTFRGWSPGERRWWERWSGLAVALPGVRRWSRADRLLLARAIRAKGGRRESEFVRLFDSHRRAGSALVALASAARTPPAPTS